ncbi:MAG: DHHW family protein [bacterium]
MQNKAKEIAVIVCFGLVIGGLLLACLITPDAEFSRSERRRLQSAPDFSVGKLLGGELFREFEMYVPDQFVWRNAFRRLKAWGSLGLLHLKDNNGLYVVNGSINKIEEPLDTAAVLHAAAVLNGISRQYFPDNNVYYAVIPDKNYFAAASGGRPALNYDRLRETLAENTVGLEYIDLFPSLDLNAYYRTDIHWRQERIVGVADKLLVGMENEVRVSDEQYLKRELYPFYGSYYGQAALRTEPDTLRFLTNSALENAAVIDHQSGTVGSVYEIGKFGGMDSYDVFLAGAKPLLTVENPACPTDRELILFRDSFGSSIAPLLLAGYARIILIDLRYVSAAVLDDYVEFSSGQDVLFLYSALVLNNSRMLKWQPEWN